jgi:hypothetical protein
MKNFERPELGRLPGRRPDEELDFDEDATLAPLDLRRILAIMRRNLVFIGLVTAAVTALAVTFAKLRSHDYTATAVIRLRDARNQISGGLADASADNGLGGTQVSPLLSLVELLSSRSMAGTVIDSLPLLRLDAEGMPLHYVSTAVVGGADHTDSLSLRFGRDGVALDDGGATQGVAYGQLIGNDSFKVAIAQEPPEGRARIFLGSRDAAIKALLLSLDVRPRENTDVVDVHFTASDSVIAQAVANRLVRQRLLGADRVARAPAIPGDPAQGSHCHARQRAERAGRLPGPAAGLQRARAIRGPAEPGGRAPVATRGAQ